MIEYLKNTLITLGVFIIGIALGLLLFYLVYIFIRLITKNKKLKKIRELVNPLNIIQASVDEFNNSYANKKTMVRLNGFKDIIENMIVSISKCFNPTVTTLSNSFHNASIEEVINTGKRINDLVYNLIQDILSSKEFKASYTLYRGKSNATIWLKKVFKKEEPNYFDKDFNNLSINEIIKIIDDIINLGKTFNKLTFKKDKGDEGKIPLLNNVINKEIEKAINDIGKELIILFSHDDEYEVTYA